MAKTCGWCLSTCRWKAIEILCLRHVQLTAPPSRIGFGSFTMRSLLRGTCRRRVFEEIATDLGLGMEKFRACLNSEHSRSCGRKGHRNGAPLSHREHSELYRQWQADQRRRQLCRFSENHRARVGPTRRSNTILSQLGDPHEPNSLLSHYLTSCFLLRQCWRRNDHFEKVVRETYRKLENYNAAAQIFQNEYTKKSLRSDANLSFELSDFRSGNVSDILYKRYADLVTLPTGDIVSLTRGGHSLDGGPQEATYAAAWEPGRYASVFDPAWTIADVFHFEAARYYDVKTYVGYQVTVKLEGRSRTYRALALFHESQLMRSPEFWDAIVNGVGDVWKEKRPAYRSKTRRRVVGSVSELDGTSVDNKIFQATARSQSLTVERSVMDRSVMATYRTPSSTALPFWLSPDDTEHASGFHGGTAEYAGECSRLPGNLQRCRVTVDKFVAFDTGVLDYITPFFTHFGTKDLKTENRTGPTGTTVACAAATGVAFSVCLIGTSCGATASVSLSVLIASASSICNRWQSVARFECRALYLQSCATARR